MANKEIIPLPNSEIIQESEVPSLLTKIRPAWQSKHLIERVRHLILIDPSSACQRIFNAAVHDLKEKIIIAGIDIAREVASINKLPIVEKEEDILDKYSTYNLINLAYFMGILTRPEWRRVLRSYEIRRDLEHEDDEYEAGIEDCVYIFRTCVEAILSKDPIRLLRVDDVKKIVQKPVPAFPSEELLEDFQHAPIPRQKEIAKFLIQIAFDKQQLDIVIQNAMSFIQQIQKRMHDQVKLDIANYIQHLLGRGLPEDLHVKIAYLTGALPYLKQTQLKDFFQKKLFQMQEVGYGWQKYPHHGVLLRGLIEIGGLRYCPEPPKIKILKWMVLAFIGEISYRHPRPVFYSDTADPLIREIVSDAKDMIGGDLKNMAKDKEIAIRLQNKPLARRFETLIDLVDVGEDKGIKLE